MTQRILHLAAYDVSDPGRLRDALEGPQGLCQRPAEIGVRVLPDTSRASDACSPRSAACWICDEDRFFLVRLDPRGKIRTLGVAVKPTDPPWFYVG